MTHRDDVAIPEAAPVLRLPVTVRTERSPWTERSVVAPVSRIEAVLLIVRAVLETGPTSERILRKNGVGFPT
jgi:hypothetical protein